MKDRYHCTKCGQSLPQGSELGADWSALERARKKLKKEIGFGVPDETYKRNIRQVTNNYKNEGDIK